MASWHTDTILAYKYSYSSFTWSSSVKVYKYYLHCSFKWKVVALDAPHVQNSLQCLFWSGSYLSWTQDVTVRPGGQLGRMASERCGHFSVSCSLPIAGYTRQALRSRMGGAFPRKRFVKTNTVLMWNCDPAEPLRTGSVSGPLDGPQLFSISTPHPHPTPTSRETEVTSCNLLTSWE